MMSACASATPNASGAANGSQAMELWSNRADAPINTTITAAAAARLGRSECRKTFFILVRAVRAPLVARDSLNQELVDGIIVNSASAEDCWVRPVCGKYIKMQLSDDFAARMDWPRFACGACQIGAVALHQSELDFVYSAQSLIKLLLGWILQIVENGITQSDIRHRGEESGQARA